MKSARFEWGEEKDKENQEKHNVPFSLAQYAFLDSKRIIVEDINHTAMRKIDFIVLGVLVKE